MKTLDTVFQIGNRIRIVNYSPFRGLVGTIQQVDAISELDEPFCFYLVDVEGAHLRQSVWFQYDEVEPVCLKECQALSVFSEQ